MRCVRPITGFRVEGQRKLVFGSPREFIEQLQLRCGSCIGCDLERSRQWAVRCMHEASLYRMSSFVTLTYDDEHLRWLSLNHRDWQLFAKRARRKLGPFRFFMAGEYGEREWRPHFHAAMFGVHFGDRYPWRKSPSGFQLYRSATLEELWPHGNAEIGDVTFQSAAYIARYVVKKVRGDGAEEHYMRVDVRSGELYRLEPEYCQMSRRPGIGKPWFDKYAADVFPHDRVVVNGVEQRPPRFYLELLKKDTTKVGVLDEVEWKRFLTGQKLEEAEGPSLRSMELVAKARLRARSL